MGICIVRQNNTYTQDCLGNYIFYIIIVSIPAICKNDFWYSTKYDCVCVYYTQAKSILILKH